MSAVKDMLKSFKEGSPLEQADNWIYILGINGWFVGSHDASACLIRANSNMCEIVTALEEEKISEVKGAYDTFPVLAVKEVLALNNLSPDDIHHVCIGWNYPGLYSSLGRPFEFSDKQILQEIFSQPAPAKTQLHYIDHHLAHAASTCRTSGFKSSTGIILDGEGEGESGTVWRYENETLTKLNSISVPASLGYLFEAVNIFLRFKHHESGKTMGLAPYGEPVYTDKLTQCFKLSTNTYDAVGGMHKLFERIVKRSTHERLDYQKAAILMWSAHFEQTLKLKPSAVSWRSFYDVDEVYKNLAASVQRTVERVVSALTENVVASTGLANVCMAGGVALNCSMNGILRRQSHIENLYIHPAAGDSGVALGAALEVAHELGLKSEPEQAEFNPYLGRSYKNSEIIKVLKNCGIAYKEMSDASNYIAGLLERDCKLALFQGGNEWGPRALGNRSIIARADVEQNLDLVNDRIKSRELGRPLGPSLLEEDAHLLSRDVTCFNRHMTAAYYADPEQNRFAAVTHVNKTYRPQYVNENSNPMYYRQLRAIKQRLGASIVINTSFNLETPIIYYPAKAVEFLQKRALDAVVFNNSIVVEKP